jgi:hypothetical protein
MKQFPLLEQVRVEGVYRDEWIRFLARHLGKSVIGGDRDGFKVLDQFDIDKPAPIPDQIPDGELGPGGRYVWKFYRLEEDTWHPTADE